MYSRGTDKPTIVLEAVASYDLWIWHAFFGAPGTMNDLNILDRSPIFDDIINGIAPEVNFYVNGNIIDRRTSIRNRQAHQNLKNDLIENIWAKFGHLPNNI